MVRRSLSLLLLSAVLFDGRILSVVIAPAAASEIQKDCCNKKKLEPAFKQWVETANQFCNTLVDRIVVGFPKKDAEAMRGKLLRVEGELYTIETSPGKQVTARTGSNTKFEKNFKGMEGDWIEATVSPDMHIQALKKSTPAYTLEGDVLKVDGDFFTVMGEGGKEVRLQTGKDTKLTGSHKVGDRIRAEYTPDGQALSIKEVKIPRGPGGA